MVPDDVKVKNRFGGLEMAIIIKTMMFYNN
jgi:hypothetical protein